MNSALYPIITQLEFASGIADDDSAPQRLDKLEALLGQATSDVKSVAPLFADLLSIPQDGRYPPLNLTPQAQKARTLDALNNQLVGLSKKQPVLLVFEDLHWIDPTTQEDLDLMVDRIQDAPVFALLTFRPEYDAPWVGQSHVHFMALNRLTRRESLELVRNVAADADFDADVLDEVATKADGVPLFMEELTRALLEGGSSETIPETIQASLLARFDRLGPAKDVAQVGAVIGREFDYRLIAAVSDLDESHLNDRLSTLTESQLVFVRGAPPDASYTFKHALIQDAAYESLLKSKRRSLHKSVAENIEARLPDVATTQPELLAHHFTEADVPKEATEYWIRAAERANERSAHEEALRHSLDGLKLLGSLSNERQRMQRELALQTTLGNAQTVVDVYSSTKTYASFERAFELARALGDDERAANALLGLHGYHDVRAQHHQAVEWSEKGLELARSTEGKAVKICGFWFTGIDAHWIGDLATAAHWYQQVVDLHDLSAPPLPIAMFNEEPGLCCRIMYSHVLWSLGYPDRARDMAEKAVWRARELEHPYTTGFTTTWAMHVYIWIGDQLALQELAREMADYLTAQRVQLWAEWAKMLRGYASAAVDGNENGVHEMVEAATKLERSVALQAFIPVYLTDLAKIYLQFERHREGIAACERALEMTRDNDERFYEPETYRVKGVILATQPQPEFRQAEACFDSALEISRTQTSKSFELRTATSLARLWRDHGKTKEARDLLAPVYDWFTEGFDTADLKEAKGLLDELS